MPLWDFDPGTITLTVIIDGEIVTMPIIKIFRDTDGDGVNDDIDRCPDDSGEVIGCPDTDGDGVADIDDACINETGTINGCPDNDGDGFVDMIDEDANPDRTLELDLCPTESGLILQSPEHASCAAAFYLNSITAFNYERNNFGFNGRNDCGDAFRHAFFNALNSKVCNIIMAQEFGDAHECDSPMNNEREMDFNNNEVGRNIGSNNGAAFDVIAEQICTELSNGNLFILSDPRNSNSNLISSNGCNCN